MPRVSKAERALTIVLTARCDLKLANLGIEHNIGWRQALEAGLILLLEGKEGVALEYNNEILSTELYKKMDKFKQKVIAQPEASNSPINEITGDTHNGQA